MGWTIRLSVVNPRRGAAHPGQMVALIGWTEFVGYLDELRDARTAVGSRFRRTAMGATHSIESATSNAKLPADLVRTGRRGRDIQVVDYSRPRVPLAIAWQH
jgi:hypothetical protein